MKFEEVLPLMREGKKAKHARMRDNEYWILGHIGLPQSEKIFTMIKVYGNPFENERTADCSTNSWGIERWAIMEDTWEVIDE